MAKTLEQFLSDLAQEVKNHKKDCPIHGGDQKKSIEQKMEEAKQEIADQNTLEKLIDKDPKTIMAIMAMLNHDVYLIAKVRAAIEILVWRKLLSVNA